MGTLSNQVAIVTGGGQGIGKAIALRFAREGADIGVIDVNLESAETTSRLIRDNGRRAITVKADVAEAPAVQAGIQRIVAEKPLQIPLRLAGSLPPPRRGRVGVGAST